MAGIFPSLSMRAAGGVLVFHWDGFRLRGGLYRRSEGRAVASATAAARSSDLSAAIGEIVEQIKHKGYSIPGRASLVTANCVIALLDLPVSPDKPRAASQMQELIRWELEPVFAQQNDSWTVGAMLQGLGLLTAEQRREVAVEAELSAAAGGRRRSVRFGELAVEKGFVTTDQVEECLRLRDSLVVPDDEIACGWQAQADDGEALELHGSWLSCGVGWQIRRRVQAAFRDNRLALEWIYPQHGSGFALIPPADAAGKPQLLIECHPEHLCLVAGKGGQVSSLRVEPLRERSVSPEMLAEAGREELSRPPGQVWLRCTHPKAQEIAEGLSALVDSKVQLLSEADGVLAGAASHLLGLSPESTAVRADAKEPRPPIWRNGDVVRVAAAILVLAVVGGAEWFLSSGLEAKKLELVDLESAFSEQLELNKKLRSIATVTQELSAEVDARTLEVEAATEELELYESVLIRRRAMVPQLLLAIRDSLNDEVVVDAINESADAAGFFKVEAWSLTDTSAQLFTNQLDRALQDLGLTVTDRSLRRATGRLGLDGYSMEMRLVPRLEEEAVASEQSGRKAGATTEQ